MGYIVWLFFTINVECTFKRIMVSTDVITFPNPRITANPPTFWDTCTCYLTKDLSGMRTNPWLTGQR
jgi:hypothetical protein